MKQPMIQPSPSDSHAPQQVARPGIRIGGLTRVAAAVVVALLPLSTLSAQNSDDPNKVEAPQPRPPSKPASTLAGMASAMLLGALVVGVNFIPSKRGHQD
ncbi:MAG: hypothetical protein H7210_05770 [Pyrinomonadaceae bacterium]|nr:hypothetical protein [Phycisphaerales bacterium]